jgi:hypothetical protein
MFANKTKVLLVLPSEVLDRARVLAGKATTTLKLPVSLQIVLRALIEEGLKRSEAPALLENFERQALAVRDIRRAAREAVRNDGPRREAVRNDGPRREAVRNDGPAGAHARTSQRPPSGAARPRRGK